MYAGGMLHRENVCLSDELQDLKSRLVPIFHYIKSQIHFDGN